MDIVKWISKYFRTEIIITNENEKYIQKVNQISKQFYRKQTNNISELKSQNKSFFKIVFLNVSYNINMSRYIQVRANNVSSDQKISFKSGFPVVSFTIPSQNAMLDPRSIRINGRLVVYKNATPPHAGAGGFSGSPVYEDDAPGDQVSMDNRLGIYGVMDEFIVRHDKSKQICESIKNYNRYMQSYLGLTSSEQDLIGHMNQSALIQPNAEAMFKNVVANGTDPGGTSDNVVPKSFSVVTPSGFTRGGSQVNLMTNSFGAVTIEIRLSPDANCLFSRTGALANVANAFYELSDLSLSCEVMDIPAEQLPVLSAQTSGSYTFNTITSLYTTINSTNAQIQYALGLKNLQSAFMNFCPSSHINTLQHNGLAITMPSNADSALAEIKTLQFLKGGVNYPAHYTIRDNSEITGNDTSNQGKFVVGDPQVAKMYYDSVVPEQQVDRTSISPENFSRNYSMIVDGTDDASYKQVYDGGSLFGLGVRYSQYNQGEDFSSEQFGVALETTLTSDNPVSVFLYFKSKATLLFDSSSVQLIH